MNLVGKSVVVTTENIGVFFGTLVEIDTKNKSCGLSDARVCIYWSEDVHGFIGLAANGPTEGCRISAAAPYQHLERYTSITLCSDAATSAWEAEPWG